MAEYIELEEAVKAFNNFDAGRADSPSCTLLTPEEFAEYLYEIPAADVAPVVHGCFEPCFDENGNWRQGFAKCSNCGKEYYAQVINHFGFCPNCGAKMDGGVSDEAD